MSSPEILKTKLAEFVGGETDAQIIASLNAVSTTYKKPIPTFDIRRYLHLNGLWLGIKNSTSNAAVTAIDTLNDFKEFDIRDAAVEGAISATLDGLVADSGISEFIAAHKTAILAMGESSWSYENYKRDINNTDLANARAWQ